MFGLASADGPETGGEGAVVEGLKSAADVVRGVPRHIGERGEGQCGYAGGGCLLGEVGEQLTPDPAPGPPGMYRDLLDVVVAVDHVGDQVAGGCVGGVRGDPGPARLVVSGKYVKWQRVVVGDLRHADISKALSGGALDDL